MESGGIRKIYNNLLEDYTKERIALKYTCACFAGIGVEEETQGAGIWT